MSATSYRCLIDIETTSCVHWIDGCSTVFAKKTWNVWNMKALFRLHYYHPWIIWNLKNRIRAKEKCHFSCYSCKDTLVSCWFYDVKLFNYNLTRKKFLILLLPQSNRLFLENEKSESQETRLTINWQNQN